MLTDDVFGEVRHLVLCLPAQFSADCPEACADALSLCPEAALILVSHAASAAGLVRLAQTLRTGSVTAVPVADGVELTPWVRDAVLFADGPSGRPLLLGCAQGTAGARNLCRALADTGLFEDGAGEPLPVRGGNLLACGRTLLLGRDEWLRWQGASSGRAGKGELDPSRRVVLVGTEAPAPYKAARFFRGPDGSTWRSLPPSWHVEPRSWQPFYHIDLFVAPAGRGSSDADRLIVGDARAGARLAGRPDPDQDVAEGLDEVATVLAGQGFAIHRAPVVLLSEDDAGRRVRSHLVFSPLNCIVEDAGTRRVWLPRTTRPGLEGLEMALVGLWQELGFSAVVLGRREGPTGADTLATLGAGLHCLAGVARRGAHG